jgi:DNA-binding transcriptional LysR family regulator
MIVFEAAARLGSFTAAARELGIGQPAVSYQVTLLEDQLAHALFRRLHRGVSLTQAGRELYDSVSSAFGQVDRTVEGIKSRRNTRLSVGTDFAFASFILMPNLADFTTRHPDIEVNVVTNQTGRFRPDENIDIELSFGHCGAKGTLLLPERVAAVCSPGFIAENGAPQTPADLTDFSLLHLDHEIPDRWFDWESWLRAAGVEESGPLYGHRFNTYLLVLSAALAGQGIALGWTALLQQQFRQEQLVRVTGFEVTSDRGYVMTPRAVSHRQEQINAFVAWATDMISDGNFGE